MTKPRGNAWQADFRLKGKRYRKDFPTKEEAQAFEEQSKQAARQGRPIPGSGYEGSITLQRLAQVTYEAHWKGTKAEDTAVKNSEDVVEVFGPNTDPNTIDEREIDRGAAVFASRGLSNATINRKLNALSKILRMGYRQQYVSRVPTIQRRKESQGRIRMFSKEEEASMHAWLVHRARLDFADFVMLCFDTGMRRGEALRVEYNDVKDGRLTIPMSKTSAGLRTIPLTERSKTMIERRKTESDGHKKIFPNFTKNSVDHLFKKMREGLGMEHDDQFVLHTCRHSYVSRLVMAGVDLVSVQKLAGHASLAQTQRYAHLTGIHLDAAVQKLEDSRQHGFFPAEKAASMRNGDVTLSDQALAALGTTL